MLFTQKCNKANSISAGQDGQFRNHHTRVSACPLPGGSGGAAGGRAQLRAPHVAPRGPGLLFGPPSAGGAPASVPARL